MIEKTQESSLVTKKRVNFEPKTELKNKHEQSSVMDPELLEHHSEVDDRKD
jgi:hypothetical protein